MITIRMLLILLCGLCCQMSYAQILVTGTLVDESNKFVEYATVFVEHAETKEVIDGIITDSKGQYELQLKEEGQYILTVNFLGFADHSQTIDVTKSIELEQIVMKNSDNVLLEAVVTSERALIEKRNNKLIFNVEQSPLKEGFSGTEVLERSPNVIIDNSGNILMRNQQARILINGKISNLSNEDLAIYIQSLRSDEIQKIEVQSHLAANTDAEDVGGVINIILKRQPLGFNGSIRMDETFKTGGDYDLAPGININYGTEKMNIYGVYSYRRFAQTSPVNYKNEYSVTNNYLVDTWDWTELWNRNEYKVGMIYDATNTQTLGFEFYKRRNIFDFDNVGFLNLYNNNESGEDDLLEAGLVNFDGRTDVKLNNYSFNYSWDLDSLDSNLKFFADYSDFRVQADNASQSEYQEQLFSDYAERNGYTAKTNLFSAQIDLEKKFKNGFSIDAGSKWSYLDRHTDIYTDNLVNEEWVANPDLNSFDYEENIVGVYAMLGKTFNEKNFIQIGLRFENTQLNRIEPFDDFEIKQNYSKLFPSAYYSRELANGNSLSLSYSRKTGRPPLNYLDNYTLRLNDFSYEIGNPKLLPEYINKYELSFKQSKQTFSLYLNHTTDILKSTHLLEGQTTYFQVVNRGVEHIAGFEYNRFGNIKDWWFIKGTGGFYRSMFKAYDQNEFTGANTGYFSLSNNFKLGKGVNVDISAEYDSGSLSGFCKTGPMYTVDLMIQKSFLDNKFTVRAYVTDVFNQLQFCQDCDFVNFTTYISHKEKSRTFRVSMNYNFASKKEISERTIQSSKNEVRGL